MTFDVEKIREDFPIFSQKIYGKPLVYLDSAATSQAPRQVLAAIEKFYNEIRSNVHRGVYHLSERATESYEASRKKIQKFIHAESENEIVFVRGATEGINLVAHCFAKNQLKAGDEVVVSHMEHHSNIVPWQMACEATGAKLKVIPVTDRGELVLEEYKKLLGPQTKLVSVVHVSNALGTINPVRDIIDLAHREGIPVLLDGAQAIPHLRVNVSSLDCDFYTFSGHKLFGPTGIGVLYGKTKWLDALPPYQGGGDMIRSVSFEKTVYNDLPYKFEAGTPNIAGSIGLGAAIDYLTSLDFPSLTAHETTLLNYATDRIKELDSIRLIGEAPHKTAIVSFVLNKTHPHDVATVLDREGIAIRAGHHCTQPLMARFNVPATSRASFSFYNTREEVNMLIAGIKKVLKIFG